MYGMCAQVRVALRAGVASPGIPELAYQAGLAMEWVTELCCTPLFYHRWCLLRPASLQDMHAPPGATY
jgi:hypothetical protein